MLATELQSLARQSFDQLAPDDELLRRYAETRDEVAFAELVRRHGSLVLGVGRRILGDRQAGEDILQATFLLLAKKADQVRWQRTIAPGYIPRPIESRERPKAENTRPSLFPNCCRIRQTKVQAILPSRFCGRKCKARSTRNCRE